MSENIICFDMMPTSKIFLTFPVNNETVKAKTKIPNKNPKKICFFCFTPIEKLKKKQNTIKCHQVRFMMMMIYELRSSARISKHTNYVFRAHNNYTIHTSFTLTNWRFSIENEKDEMKIKHSICLWMRHVMDKNSWINNMLKVLWCVYVCVTYVNGKSIKIDANEWRFLIKILTVGKGIFNFQSSVNDNATNKMFVSMDR